MLENQYDNMVGGSPLDISLFGHPLLLNSAASASEEDLSENDNMYDGGDDNHSQGPETIGSGVGDRHGPPDHLATPRRSGGEKQHYQKVPLEPKSSWRPSDRLSCENSHTTREWATQPSDCPRPTSGARRGFAPAGTSVFLLGDHCLSRARAVSGTLEDSMLVFPLDLLVYSAKLTYFFRRNAPKDPAPSEIGATMHDLCPLQEST